MKIRLSSDSGWLYAEMIEAQTAPNETVEIILNDRKPQTFVHPGTGRISDLSDARITGGEVVIEAGDTTRKTFSYDCKDVCAQWINGEFKLWRPCYNRTTKQTEYEFSDLAAMTWIDHRAFGTNSKTGMEIKIEV